jgi:fatty-acid desaturase
MPNAACSFRTWTGWLLTKRVRGHDRIVKCEISDLKADPLLRLQNKHYNVLLLLLAITLGFIVPMLVCSLDWGDWMVLCLFSPFRSIPFISISEDQMN